jgi:hypothetical protein
MDPITAWALAIKAVAELLTEIVKGQPAEVRQRGLDWFVAYDNAARRAFHIPEFTVKPPVIPPAVPFEKP